MKWLIFEDDKDYDKFYTEIDKRFGNPKYKKKDNGEDDLDRVETSAYAKKRYRYPDNKPCAAKPPQEMMDDLKFPDHKYTEEEYNPDWFPCIEDIKEWSK